MPKTILRPQSDALRVKWFACARCPWSEPFTCTEKATNVQCPRCGATAYPRELFRKT